MNVATASAEEASFLAALDGAPAPVSDTQTDDAPARKLDIPALLARPDEPIPYRLDKFVADGLVTVLAGHGGEGKSLLAAGAAIAVAAGGTLAGITCSQGATLIFDAEQGERLIAQRLKLAGAPPRGLTIYEATGLNLAQHADWIVSTIHAEQAQLVIFDSLRTLAPGMAENDGDTVLPVTAALHSIARTTQAAVLVLHHRPKHGPGYRGSSVLRDQVDALFVLGRDPQDPERKTRRYLHCDPARDGKMRFDREPDERWLHIDIHNGQLTLTQADPYTANSHDATRTDDCADAILEAIGDRRLKRSAIALAIDRQPSDGTVGRALKKLTTDGLLTRHPEDSTYTRALPPGKTPGKTANDHSCHIATTPIGGGNGKASQHDTLATDQQELPAHHEAPR